VQKKRRAFINPAVAAENPLLMLKNNSETAQRKNSASAQNSFSCYLFDFRDFVNRCKLLILLVELTRIELVTS